ncbi:hypothetical protein [Paraburkholderia rhizosphaerae]|uniref:Uncharacterized protein n=1 Tax=Paraburkholderia rhizosphaerae TaxID=480658 RepID=A0A4R8LJD4_9BURK|nr:hypothetical protein [Paraburkholderia rhizosphaerae]TDY43892.1 hypothetical protein BX592_11794 [Paraburkholderia rhizosphaerae]
MTNSALYLQGNYFFLIDAHCAESGRWEVDVTFSLCADYKQTTGDIRKSMQHMSATFPSEAIAHVQGCAWARNEASRGIAGL